MCAWNVKEDLPLMLQEHALHALTIVRIVYLADFA
jgi:hypothetical protein